jgi:hypothetical protein
VRFDSEEDMKRVEFLITGEKGEILREPGFLDDCAELPQAVKTAVEDFLEAHDGRLNLPIIIRIRPAPGAATC